MIPHWLAQREPKYPHYPCILLPQIISKFTNQPINGKRMTKNGTKLSIVIYLSSSHLHSVIPHWLAQRDPKYPHYPSILLPQIISKFINQPINGEKVDHASVVATFIHRSHIKDYNQDYRYMKIVKKTPWNLFPLLPEFPRLPLS